MIKKSIFVLPVLIHYYLNYAVLIFPLPLTLNIEGDNPLSSPQNLCLCFSTFVY